VRNIQAALEKADPNNKNDYKKNADAYIEKLKALDEKFKQDLSGTKNKDFITQHAAFAYLAKSYGLTQIPISGLSPDQEPSPEEMASVVAFAKEHKVKTIFFETLVDPKIAQTIANEIGAKTDVLNPIEGLTDEDISKGLDYISIMTNNLSGLVKALNE
jgi:zinc transport system substrate-binding protein